MARAQPVPSASSSSGAGSNRPRRPVQGPSSAQVGQNAKPMPVCACSCVRVCVRACACVLKHVAVGCISGAEAIERAADLVSTLEGLEVDEDMPLHLVCIGGSDGDT